MARGHAWSGKESVREKLSDVFYGLVSGVAVLLGLSCLGAILAAGIVFLWAVIAVVQAVTR